MQQRNETRTGSVFGVEALQQSDLPLDPTFCSLRQVNGFGDYSSIRGSDEPTVTLGGYA